MAGNQTTTGMEEISKMLTELGDKAESVAAYGLYDGAAVMVDEVKTAIGNIRAETFHYNAFGQRLPSNEEKEALLSAGAGVAKFDKNGSEVNTAVGFGNAGYVTIAGKRKPVALIANAINSGTSFMAKQPFMRKAKRNGSERAEQKMLESIEQKLNEILK